jgi:hypothetical protein
VPAISHNPSAPAAPVEEDLRFLDEQVGRYRACRAWERLGSRTVELDLKVGSWYEACAQTFAKGPMSVLFLFPGRRDLRGLQQAGLAEPPAGTIFAELGATGTAFKVITPDGWLPLERRETQVLALACAALTHLDAAWDQPSAAAGDITLPGGARGRYRVRLAAPDPDADQFVPVFGIARDDLYGEGEWTLSMINLGWADYEVLRQRARVCVKALEPFRDPGDAFPLVVLSGSTDLVHEVAAKLQVAAPLGITFSEKEGVLAMLLGGQQDTFLLAEYDAEREQVLLWWHEVRTHSGAYSVVVTDEAPDTSGRWAPTAVEAVFEFGRQAPG